MWPAVILAGLVRDGFMAILITLVMELRGIGVRYAATATGLIMATSSLANVVSPPLGNSLATFGPSVPFALWSALALFGVFSLWRVQGVR